LLKEELDQFKGNYPERFKLFYSVDTQPSTPWTQGVGFVTKEML
jgi:hypothetical protein